MLALVAVVSTGFLLATPLAVLAGQPWLKWVVVAVTMFFMAWPLELAQFKSRISNPTAPLVATFINVCVAPLLLWPFALLMPDEIAASMVLVFAAPCTLASAAVWTARAGGDDSVALMVTIITSCLCFLTTPATIYLFIGKAISSAILTGLIWKLLFCIVIPIALAQLARAPRNVGDWARQNKPLLNKIAQCGLLLIVLIGAVASALRINGSSANAYAVLIVVSVVVMLLVHVVVLVISVGVSRKIGLSRAEEIAVAFAGSQKTLMVALSVAASLGVTVIPLVAYHSFQLLIDTLIADFWFKADEGSGGDVR